MTSKHWNTDTDEAGIAWLCFDKHESAVNVLSAEAMPNEASQVSF